MRIYVIVFRSTRRAEPTQWAQFMGMREDAKASARDLLAQLREDDKGAAVWVDGKRVQVKGA